MSSKRVVIGVAAAALGLYSVPAAARPLNVGVRLSGYPVSRSIGPAGGSLTLRSPQGRFRLVIPKGALAAKTRISMRGATPGRGWPLRRVVAVQLAPEGLRLYRAAVLTITPRRPMPVSQRAPLAWLGSGRELHLYPSTSRTAAVTLGISHFCGYAVAVGPDGKLHRINRRPPITLDAQTEAAIGSALADLTRAKVPLDSARYRDAYAEALIPVFEHLAKRLHAAESGGYWRGATQAAIALDSALNLQGYNDETLGFHPPVATNAAMNRRLEELRVEIQASFWRVFENAYNRAKERCSATGRYEHAREMGRIARELALLGNPEHYITTDQVQSDQRPCTCEAPQTEAWVTPEGAATPHKAQPPKDAKAMCWPSWRYVGTVTFHYWSTEGPGTPQEDFQVTVNGTWQLTEARLTPPVATATYRLVSSGGSWVDNGHWTADDPNAALQGCQWSGAGPLEITRAPFVVDAGARNRRLMASLWWADISVPGTCTGAGSGPENSPATPGSAGYLLLGNTPLSPATYGEHISGTKNDDLDDFAQHQKAPTQHSSKTWRFDAQR